MKIKEFFNFEDIQKVIVIDDAENEMEMVENFVISENLKEYLKDFLEYLKDNKPERNTSVNVIGNYGTGKSHLLYFLSIILSNPEMIQYIQDDDVRESFSSIKREFYVVKYELPGSNVKLEDIFVYRVKKQLKENYGLDLGDITASDVTKDPKELVEEKRISITRQIITMPL